MPDFHLVLISSDGSREPIDGVHGDIDSACRTAFEIADEAADPAWSTSGSKPLSVSVYRDDAFELSIEVAQDRGTKVASRR